MAATRSRLLLRFQTLRSLSTNSAAEAKMPQLQREIEIDIEHEERVKPARKKYEEIRRWCKENNAMIKAIQKAAVKVIADRPRWNLPKDPKERAAKVKQWMVAIDESSMTMEQKLNDKIELEILQTQRKDDAKLEQLMGEIDESKENNAMINAIQKAAVKVIADRPRWNLPKDPKERAAKVEQWMVAIDESSMTMEQKLNDKIELEILQTQRKDDAKLEQLMGEIDESNNWLLRRWARKRDLLHKLEDEEEEEAQPQLAETKP